MATAASHHDLLHLQPLTQFLTLAPATSSSYPAHRRTESESTSTSTSVTQPSAAQDEVASAVTIPAAEKQVVIVSPIVAELEKKNRRSSSLSSTGSIRTAGQFRFLRLGPVHHGAHIEGDNDWSEEVAVE